MLTGLLLVKVTEILTKWSIHCKGCPACWQITITKWSSSELDRWGSICGRSANGHWNN